jgi:hypothetical protein
MTLPTRFRYAGNFAPVRHHPETHAAQTKISINASPAAAIAAAVPKAGGKLLRFAHFDNS